MKRNLLLGLLLSAGLAANGQNYMPITLTGFNADVVADGPGSAMNSTNNDVDGGNHVFVAQNFINPSGQSPGAAGSLPASGLITSAVTTTPGLTFQLSAYTGNNSLRIASAASGSISFGSPSSASDIYVLLTPVAYTTTYLINATVNFADGTNQAFTGISVPNWFGGANPAYSGNSRVHRTSNAISVNAQGPRMYQYQLALNPTNTGKPIQSIQFTNTSAATSGNILHVLAVTTVGGAPSLANDVGVVSLSAPNSGCSLSSQETVTITLKNFGSNAQTNIPVSYTINNGTPVTEVYPGPIASGATATYAFTAKADLSAIASYNLAATTALSGDAQLSNDTFSRTINKFSPPNTPTVAVSGNPAICPGTTVLLTASGATGAIYQWYKDGTALSGITSATYAASQAGNYSIVASANGCASNPSNALTITLSQAPATPVLSVSGSTNICSGNSVTLTATSSTSGVTFSWLLDGSTIPGASGAAYVATTLGRYTVMATYGNCTSNASGGVTVTVRTTPVKPAISKVGNMLTSSSGVGNQWYLNGTVIPGATSHTYQVTVSGTYTVVVTNNNCNSEISDPVSLVVSGIGETASFPVSAYPNPSAGIFIVAFPEERSTELQVTDLTGRIIQTKVVTGKETTIDLTTAARGLYILKIKSGTTTNTLKLRKE